jgi:hypothetical protein
MVMAIKQTATRELPGVSAVSKDNNVSSGPAAVGGFQVKNRWLGGSRSRSFISGLGVASAMDGAKQPTGIIIESGAAHSVDAGAISPHPVEFLLHGVAASITESIVREAKELGIELSQIESRADALFDRSSRTGDLGDCRRVRVKVLLRGGATTPALQELFINAVENGPVHSIFGGIAPMIFGMVD